jgi:ABC-type lipoprotein release transport system permease subunit
MQAVLMRMALRNVLRQWRRSLITACTIGVGLAALIFLDALFAGMRLSIIGIATGSLVGHAEIAFPGYDKAQEMTKTLHQPSELMQRLAMDSRVAAFTPRLFGSGVLASADGSANVSLLGVDPRREPAFSGMDRWVRGGRFDLDRGNIVVGAAMADRMHLKPGGRVVIGVGRADTGELSQEAFHITGLLRSGLDSLDEQAVIMALADAQELFALPGQVHKVSVKLQSESIAWNRADPWWSEYSKGDMVAINWREVMPQLEGAFAFLDSATALIVFALVCVAGLSIVNVLFISLYERLPEFGVMRALGTTPGQMGILIVWESAALAGLSSAIGMLLGAALTLVARQIGIPYQGVEFAGINLEETLRPAFMFMPYLRYSGIVFLCCACAAFIPARVAMRILPIRAIQQHGQ